MTEETAETAEESTARTAHDTWRLTQTDPGSIEEWADLPLPDQAAGIATVVFARTLDPELPALIAEAAVLGAWVKARQLLGESTDDARAVQAPPSSWARVVLDTLAIAGPAVPPPPPPPPPVDLPAEPEQPAEPVVVYGEPETEEEFQARVATFAIIDPELTVYRDTETPPEPEDSP